MSEHTKKHSGSCLCGKTQFQLYSEPGITCHCHCHSCQKASGAAFVTWSQFPYAGFKLTQGELAIHKSSPQVERGFCADCGSCLSYRNENSADKIDISVICLKEKDTLIPEFHIWLSNKVSWLVLNDGLPAYDEWRNSK